jgi:hypothetical protein
MAIHSILSSIDQDKDSTALTGKIDALNLCRRWGNHVAGRTELSPPVRSLKYTSSFPRQSKSTNHSTQQSVSPGMSSSENHVPNVLRIDETLNQVIALGIAARTNDMLPFLNALKRGIELRRSGPVQKPFLFQRRASYITPLIVLFNYLITNQHASRCPMCIEVMQG